MVSSRAVTGRRQEEARTSTIKLRMQSMVRGGDVTWPYVMWLERCSAVENNSNAAMRLAALPRWAGRQGNRSGKQGERCGRRD